METNLQYKKKYLKYKHKYYNLIVNNIQNGGSDFDEKKDNEESFKESIVGFVNYNKDRIFTIGTPAIMIIISSVIIGLLHTGVIISSMHSQLFLTIALIVLSVYKGYDVYSDIQERAEEVNRKEKMLKEKAEKMLKEKEQKAATIIQTYEDEKYEDEEMGKSDRVSTATAKNVDDTKVEETPNLPSVTPRTKSQTLSETVSSMVDANATVREEGNAQGTPKEIQGTSALNTQIDEKKPPPPPSVTPSTGSQILSEKTVSSTVNANAEAMEKVAQGTTTEMQQERSPDLNESQPIVQSQSTSVNTIEQITQLKQNPEEQKTIIVEMFYKIVSAFEPFNEYPWAKLMVLFYYLSIEKVAPVLQTAPFSKKVKESLNNLIKEAESKYSNYLNKFNELDDHSNFYGTFKTDLSLEIDVDPTITFPMPQGLPSSELKHYLGDLNKKILNTK